MSYFRIYWQANKVLNLFIFNLCPYKYIFFVINSEFILLYFFMIGNYLWFLPVSVLIISGLSSIIKYFIFQSLEFQIFSVIFFMVGLGLLLMIFYGYLEIKILIMGSMVRYLSFDFKKFFTAFLRWEFLFLFVLLLFKVLSQFSYV